MWNSSAGDSAVCVSIAWCTTTERGGTERVSQTLPPTTLPAPTVLGGSCVVMNELPLPLIQTSSGQISAQIPENLPPGPAVVQVRSILRAEQSDPVVVTIRR